MSMRRRSRNTASSSSSRRAPRDERPRPRFWQSPEFWKVFAGCFLAICPFSPALWIWFDGFFARAKDQTFVAADLVMAFVFGLKVHSDSPRITTNSTLALAIFCTMWALSTFACWSWFICCFLRSDPERRFADSARGSGIELRSSRDFDARARAPAPTTSAHTNANANDPNAILPLPPLNHHHAGAQPPPAVHHHAGPLPPLIPQPPNPFQVVAPPPPPPQHHQPVVHHNPPPIGPPVAPPAGQNPPFARPRKPSPIRITASAAQSTIGEEGSSRASTDPRRNSGWSWKTEESA